MITILLITKSMRHTHTNRETHHSQTYQCNYISPLLKPLLAELFARLENMSCVYRSIKYYSNEYNEIIAFFPLILID